MHLLRVLVLLLGLLICVWATWLIWPGYSVDGRFYSYPVSGSLLAMVASGWLVILGGTFFVLKKMKSKSYEQRRTEQDGAGNSHRAGQ